MKNADKLWRAPGELLVITLGSLVYALATVLFIFPHALLLGGTSGISVILTRLLPFSPSNILVGINISLIVIAFLVLGKGMAVKTTVGSLLTTALFGLFGNLIPEGTVLLPCAPVSAVVGAALIALASGLLFFVDSGSGGTDIVALIVQKFSRIRIGRALLLTDVLIVLVGGLLDSWPLLLVSALGLCIKTFGIDAVIALITRIDRKRGERNPQNGTTSINTNKEIST
jgi:uncharacterized membrane-anchored protein YitT (DUF2179 family)